MLTRLEAKVAGAGLNLTRASLDATSKYPWPRRPGTRKFGVYADDLPVFEWLRRHSPGGDRRCLEAQVMDWADDVAYSVHDVEDGVHARLVLLAALADAAERAAVCEQAATAYSGEFHHSRARSNVGNSRMTTRVGRHAPVSVSVVPPRARYLPPYA